MQKDDPNVSVRECVIVVAPPMRSSIVGGERFAAIDRTKENPFEGQQ